MLTRQQVEERAKQPFTLRSAFGNILINTDSYKISHPDQYPPDSEQLVSYYESRGQGDDPWNNGHTTHTLFLELQVYLKRYGFLRAITHEDVEEAQVYWYLHFGFHYFRADLWTDLINDDVFRGNLPIRISAIPEGTWIKKHNALIMIETLSPKFFWIGQFVETVN